MTEQQRARVHEVAVLLYECLGLEPGQMRKELTGKRPAIGEGPMGEVKCVEDVQRSLDYVLKMYGSKIEPDQAKGVGYYVLIKELCCGHPIFTMGTFAVLLIAGAKIYVEYEIRDKDWYEKDIFSYQRFLTKLEELSPNVEWVTEVEKYERKRDLPGFLAGHPEIKHYVQLGDWVNAHMNHSLAAKQGLCLHHPGAYVIVTEYMSQESLGEWGEKDAVLSRFGDQCWAGLIDYDAYHGDANKAKDLCVGFDFCDLFWGFRAAVNTWASYPVSKDRVDVVYFTDQKAEDVKLPEHTKENFSVLFSNELDLRYPQYDFMQLLGYFSFKK